MLQKGIIEEVLNKYQVKVRIPKYHKLKYSSDGTSTDDLPISIICNQPGTQINYMPEDVVLVSFENDELSKPVILGLLYRDVDTKEQINIPKVSSSLQTINDKLDSINVDNLNTFIRYSNDNGKTFTSLYDKNAISIEHGTQGIYYVANDIEIDNSSKLVYWSIINDLNIDVTEAFNIQTILSDKASIEKDRKVFTYNSSLIQMPPELKSSNTIFLSFKILKTGDLDDYHVVLTTDKNPVGTTYGSYIGISVTNGVEAPTNPSAYSWISTNDTSEYLMGGLSNALIPRLERMEKSLYGFNYSTTNHISDGTGLKDLISIDNEVNIFTAKNSDINFNSSKSVGINNTTKSFKSEGIELTLPNASNMISIVYKPNNHMSILYKGKK